MKDLFVGMLFGAALAFLFMNVWGVKVRNIENSAQRQLDFANGEMHIINQLMKMRIEKGMK